MKSLLSPKRFGSSAFFLLLTGLLFMGCNKVAMQDLLQKDQQATNNASDNNTNPPTQGTPTTPQSDSTPASPNPSPNPGPTPGPAPTPTPPPVTGCQGVSCNLDPLTTKPAVTTILLTLGDQTNAGLVINGASSQLIAETVVRYTSPVKDPKILVVLDPQNMGEDLEDIQYVTQTLLGRYNVTVITAPSTGLTLDATTGYDAIWYNNPGYPLSSPKTLETLLAFKGGIVLQGDDMARGQDGSNRFSMTALTGLNWIDNGTSVNCGGNSYPHDNNGGYQFKVSINPAKIQGDNATILNFRYGNDIDNTTVANSNVEVLATAVGGHDSCTESRPAIVRYYKN